MYERRLDRSGFREGGQHLDGIFQQRGCRFVQAEILEFPEGLRKGYGGGRSQEGGFGLGEGFCA